MILVVSSLLLTWYISLTLKKNRNLDRVKQDQVTAQVVQLAQETVKISQHISSLQTILDEKMNALSNFVDAHSTTVALQQKQFNALARSDMLSARREELLRTKELKVALERLMGVALTSRQPPASNDVLAIENLTNRIEELESILKAGDI